MALVTGISIIDELYQHQFSEAFYQFSFEKILRIVDVELYIYITYVYVVIFKLKLT